MVNIVIGAGFGDEGKGLVVDTISQMNPNSLVVRFNGGHQAGHTVVRDGIRHVFSNFGSGTLNGTPTYWSKYCTFDPVALINEYESLRKKVDKIKLYVDNLAPVCTLYDIAYNRALEESRNRHGSCGVGFGATIERHEETYKLFVQDLLFPKVVEEKLKAIKKYYLPKIATHGLNISKFQKQTEDLEPFFYSIDKLKYLIKDKVVSFVDEKQFFKTYFPENIIFEGAQGILLDQDFGFFPHVTRSNTTSKNALEIIKRNFENKGIRTYYVSRVYQTRHGRGPMSNEKLPIELINNENETNVTHKYQENFKTGILDIDLLKYALQCDSENNSSKRLFFTCLDQINSYEVPYTESEEQKTILSNKLHTLFDMEGDYSYSPETNKDFIL